MSRSSLRSLTLCVCALVFVTLFAANLSAQQPKVLAPHRFVPQRVPQSKALPSPAVRQDSVVGGLWMTGPGTKSTLHLKNVVEISPITVTPLLYLTNGHKFTLPDVTLEASGTATVDISTALTNLGIASYATLSGYVELQYKWAWDPLCATVRVVDADHSVIFTYGLRPATTPNLSPPAERRATSVLKGVWWKQESAVNGFVAVSNVTSASVPAMLEVTDNRGTVLGTHRFSVSSHGTKMVQLSELESATASEGGIDVSYPGPADALEVNGGLQDLSVGYSANLRFNRSPSAAAKASEMTVAELGLMVGAADPMMLFPAGTTFTPYSVLRNISDTEVTVTPTFWWMEAGAARSAQLKTFALAADQSQNLDVMSLLAAAGLRDFNGSVNVVFDVKGKEGALVLAAGSVDRSNNYVFEVIPRGVGESTSKSFGQWSTANGNDTMVTIWNPADEAQDFVFRLMYSGGHYLLPLHFAPRATRTFNVSEIIHNQIPDVEGNVIPVTVHEGSAILGGSHGDVEHILVAMDSGTYNVRKAICGTNCQNCDGYTSFGPMDPGSATFGVQQTKQYQFTGTYSSGAVYNIAGPWSSNKASVATVGSGTGVATGVSPGSASIGTSFSEPIYEGYICTGPSGCPVASGNPSGTANIGNVSCSPSSVTRGGSVTCTATGPSGSTFSNWQFKAGTSTVTGSGTSSNWSGVAVTSGTVSVTVTSGGQTGTPTTPVTVNPRSGFTLNAVSATSESNGFSSDGCTVSVPSPPQKTGDAVGMFCLAQYFSINTATVSDNGPNNGYSYVTSVSGTNSSGNFTAYFYVLSSDLVNTSSAFYKAQCGNYSASAKTGFISGSNLLSDTTRHESGSVQSHYENYVVAQNNSANNVGTVAEAATGLEPAQTLANSLTTTLSGDQDTILSATQVEPCGVQYDASCSFQGCINFSPYYSCSQVVSCVP